MIRLVIMIFGEPFIHSNDCSLFTSVDFKFSTMNYKSAIT